MVCTFKSLRILVKCVVGNYLRMRKILIFISILFVTKGYAQECFTPSYEKTIELDLINANPESKIFFLGETHNVSCNDILDYTMLMNLYESHNIRHFIREGAYSFNYFIDKYVTTGQLKYLDSIGSYYTVKELDDFLNALWKFNSDKLEEEKIRILGIDSEPFFHLRQMINMLEADYGKPPIIVQQVFDQLRSFKTTELTFF